jgi:hypothetical protein
MKWVYWVTRRDVTVTEGREKADLKIGTEETVKEGRKKADLKVGTEETVKEGKRRLI